MTTTSPLLELHPYSDRHRDNFFALLSRAFTNVPDCYPVADEASTAVKVTSILPVENTSTTPLLRRRQLLLAFTEGEAVGFVDFGLHRREQSGTESVGIIRYLWFDIGAREAGQALLDCAEANLAQAGVDTISAFSIPFLPFHKHLSNSSGHLRALFTLRGYEITAGEVYITWDNFATHIERLRALAGKRACALSPPSFLSKGMGFFGTSARFPLDQWHRRPDNS
jgi:hypothetical protein